MSLLSDAPDVTIAALRQPAGKAFRQALKSSCRISLVLTLAISLSGCLAALPDVPKIATPDQVKDRVLDKMYSDNDHLPVQHIKLRNAALSVIRVNHDVSQEMRSRPVDYAFGSDKPTIGDLIQALGVDGIQISLQQRFYGGQSTYETGGQSARIPALLAQTAGQQPLTGQQALPNQAYDQNNAAYPVNGGYTPLNRNNQQTLQDQARLALTDLSTRRLPFVRYKGSLGGLLDALNRSAGLVSWQEGETIYLNDTDRFAVTVPQNEDIIVALSKTIKELGGSDVVTSVDGGRIIYSAQAVNQRESIAPFLKKAMRNLSTIELQIAVVSLAVNDKSGNGFDWSQLSASITNLQNTLNNGTLLANGTTNGYATGNTYNSSGTYANVNGTSYGVTNGTGNSAVNALNGGQGITASTANQALTLAGTIGTGKILGIASGALTVGSAIAFLSTFGTTTVTQNLDLRTIAGKSVHFHSGDEIPYVKGVGIGALGNVATTNSNYYNGNSGYGNTLGTAQTDTVKTGIEVEMVPRFDSDNDLVITEMKLELSNLVEFIQLNAGAQLGTLTQPHTSKQDLTDILRIRAGQTAIIGGLQADTNAQSGNEPTMLRGNGQSSESYGLRSQNVQRNALFVILRPTVVVYDPEGPTK